MYINSHTSKSGNIKRTGRDYYSIEDTRARCVCSLYYTNTDQVLSQSTFQLDYYAETWNSIATERRSQGLKATGHFLLSTVQISSAVSLFRPPPMTDSDNSSHSYVPTFLYTSKSLNLGLGQLNHKESSASMSFAPPENAILKSCSFAIPAPSEQNNKIAMYSPEFYAACTAGGVLSCGLTHMAVTPLDLVKCNMQIDPAKYKSISSGFGILLKEQGLRGFFRGWVPTLLGYSAQGACKFGFYEFFKKYYSDLAGPENAAKYKTLIYLAGSASAEVIADVALCPMEAVKVRVQTQPGFAKGLSDGLPKFIKSEGAAGLYKGLVPLWGRQIPYTMMKFASFETIVELIYKHAIPTPKDQCSKQLQLGVSFAGGYIAGVLCAVVSHPADNLVSFLNNAKGATVGDAVKKIGLVGLFTRGLPLRIVMIGTLTGAQWGIYDAFKVFVGLPTTGGPAPDAHVPKTVHAED
ncbi:uncharacterized protein [Phyllobates terribilis]|uniref:uncharacterized protein n=1 Tax=Phyllobates terribilis TaxID=111132 RepID=UPI003CCB6037